MGEESKPEKNLIHNTNQFGFKIKLLYDQNEIQMKNKM